MLLVTCKRCISNASNLTYSFRRFAYKRHHSAKTTPKLVEIDSRLAELLKKHEKKILYNTVIDEQRIKLGLTYRRKLSIVETIEAQSRAAKGIDDVAICLKYLSDDLDVSQLYEKEDKKPVREIYHRTHFPFKESITVDDNSEEEKTVESSIDVAEDLLKEVRLRQEGYKSTNCNQWMTDYENFDDNLQSDEYNYNWKINYGTPDPRTPVSNVPCGGCGALLHCQDSSIPGYIPSEIYKNHTLKGGVHLKGITCQRCHFLKNYNLALKASVSFEDYPKILQTVSKKLSIVILMVDLLDFPCSIWPGIADIFWNTPMVIVGNKVDLLPHDSADFLKHVKGVLKESVALSGFGGSNIQAVELISAKTGFGIESLITHLQQTWKFKGDFYIVGCTNVGKSSLFNILLQSDFCKVQASDLIQRATTSIWPGTTLNLLKFPVMRPSGWRQYLRMQRLHLEKEEVKQQKELRKRLLKNTRNPEYATLIGHLGRTYTKPQSLNENPFTNSNENAAGKTVFGINENDNDYRYSRWCFDTPGVVQPDQILHLLTTQELTLTLPKTIIKPRTFSLYEGTSLFIAGLARLDYIQGPDNLKVTVFSAESLPITVCKTENADEIYAELLGSELFQVPTGQERRLKKWPALVSSKDLNVIGVNAKTACADVVLSSAGWATVTGNKDNTYVLKGWTPEGRGIYLRPPLLPKIVNYRGKKVRGSPAFVKSRVCLA